MATFRVHNGLSHLNCLESLHEIADATHLSTNVCNKLCKCCGMLIDWTRTAGNEQILTNKRGTMANGHEPVPWPRIRDDKTGVQPQRVERDKLVEERSMDNESDLVQGDYSTDGRSSWDNACLLHKL